MENNNLEFQGFARPTTTQVPDEVFDYLLPNLLGGELKVLLYICRRTFGFKKNSDTVSLNQIAEGITKKNGEVLDYGTGINKRQVQRILITLQQKKIIEIKKSKKEDGSYGINTYLLNFLDKKGVGTKCLYPPKNPLENDTPQPSQIPKGVGAPMSIGVGVSMSTTTDSKQDTDNNVNVTTNKKSKLSGLTNIDQPIEKSNLIAEDILSQLGDQHSKNYYRSVAMKIPEDVIRRLLSELKIGGARNPAKVFTSAITKFVNEQSREEVKFSLEKMREDLTNKFRKP